MYGRYHRAQKIKFHGVHVKLAGSRQEDPFQISSIQDTHTFSGIETFCIKLSH